MPLLPSTSAARPRTARRTATAMLALLVTAALAVAGRAGATADIEPPTASAPAGVEGGQAWVQHVGIFSGSTSTGAFRVPYRMIGPKHPGRRARAVLVEPPHFAVGLAVLEVSLGHDLVLGRDVAHAGVGYSTTSFGEGADGRILDPTVPGTFVEGGFEDEGGRTDDEILVEFARALAADPDATRMLGRVGERLLTGVSDSGDPVQRLIAAGRAEGVFDLALVLTTEGHDPQAALAAGRFTGRAIVVNSEAEDSTAYVDRGGLRDRYRFHVVAGSPHVPDPLFPFFSNATTPVGFVPAARAHFVHGLRWLRGGAGPPPSTHLRSSDGVTLDRDANGNAVAVDAHGRRVPRLPAIELGEARFVTGFLGSVEQVRTVAELGFRRHGHYAAVFSVAVALYAVAGYALPEDALAMHRRASLCPPLTFTQTYLEHPDEFAAVARCGG